MHTTNQNESLQFTYVKMCEKEFKEARKNVQNEVKTQWAFQIAKNTCEYNRKCLKTCPKGSQNRMGILDSKNTSKNIRKCLKTCPKGQNSDDNN